MPPQREDFGTAAAGDVARELEDVKPQSKNRLPDSQLLSKLPFTFMDVKHSIPSKLFEPSLPLSIYYCVRDFFFAAALLFAVNYADQFLVGSPFAWMRWILWPVYSLAQGTIMWALFVVGHDCGHGSFSRSKTINHIFGHITHAPILVPYHSWRISHRHHHANTGNLNTDETWKPASQTEYDGMDSIAKIFRYHLIPFVWPLYLLGARGKSDKEAGFGFSAWFKESHFNPSMELFKPHERLAVLVSSLSCGAFFALLLYLGSIYGAVPLLLNYWAPWIVFGAWLSLVTYLHHTDDSVPWYINEEWDKLKGGLCTIDRDYGDFINHIHHDIGTHVVHHLFYSIPHYNLKAATEAIKPVIGKYYRQSEKSIIGGYFDSAKFCRFVPDFGSLRYYTSYSKSAKKQK
mmetsp:Transcript_23260/g.40019  ORF Transcript_23260/g.40019 Transcript_23260/m.40019 type:complete len:403 (+) Transcript_23260:86-1294(+)|eukprot:CAMPEP_0196654284 /NCGR_PEP_ID=MMETSP1086-20130531/3985_1 /TAXON_ID=77921 /ORGANISM="Cyanoptyche  gloeocystis , Strain SAG4.97" /LENGTH=402 /DNA_ID=CAMNT_0041985961 /DNA_START=86 /DNA_END=1294 /DNA_ORIENTATION=+